MSTVLNRFRFIFHLIFPEHIEIIRSLDLTEESLVEESPIKYAGEQQVRVSSRCRFEESLVQESPIK